MCVATFPDEADTPLVVDPDAVLTSTCSTQRLQSIFRWSAQIIKPFSSVDWKELPQRNPLELPRKCPVAFTEKQFLGLLVPERPDHIDMITRYGITANRYVREVGMTAHD